MGYNFFQWSDGLTTNPRQDIQDTNVTTNIAVIAEFAIQFTIIFQTDGTSNTTLDGATTQTVISGGNCQPVTANAPVGFQFVRWELNGIEYSLNNPLTITNVMENMILTAIFSKVPHAGFDSWLFYEIIQCCINSMIVRKFRRLGQGKV